VDCVWLEGTEPTEGSKRKEKEFEEKVTQKKKNNDGKQPARQCVVDDEEDGKVLE